SRQIDLEHREVANVSDVSREPCGHIDATVVRTSDPLVRQGVRLQRAHVFEQINATLVSPLRHPSAIEPPGENWTVALRELFQLRLHVEIGRASCRERV